MTTKTTDIALKNEAGLDIYKDLSLFQALMPGQIEYAMEMVGNVAMLGNITKMETIKVPAGGAVSWELPAMDGTRTAKFFDAIIIKPFMGRKFWEKAFGTTTGTPPDCSSVDGFEGNFGECAKCKYNQFIETDKGKKKPCQEFIKLVFLMDDSVTPYALTVPVKSMENLSKYIQKVASGGRMEDGTRIPPQMPYAVVTRFALEKAKSVGGIDYAKITFQMVGGLPNADADKMGALVRAYIPVLERLMKSSGGTAEDSTD